MRALVVCLVFALAGVPASAAHCTTYSTTSESVYDTNPLGAPLVPRHYVDPHYNEALEAYSIWVYEESNGIDGLQRGDEVIDDTCHGMIDADTVVL